MPTFRRRSLIDAPADEVFAWHARPGALERLIPPWERIRVLERSGGIQDGARTVLQLRRGPFRFRWVAEHADHQPGRGFSDEQVKGPFARWRHRHRFLPEGEERCVLEDEVDYRLPLQPLAGPLAGRKVQRDLERTFRFRHRRTADDLGRHRRYRPARRLRVAISGASGLVGTALTAFLSAGGHRVTQLVRRPADPEAREVYWRPGEGAIDAEGLEGIDAVVHLSGRSIAAPRWTRRVRREIRDSRVASTRLLAETLAGLEFRPRVLVCASAVGYYGDRGAEPLVETEAAGDGFLAEVCEDWEAAAEPARAAGVRVVNLRNGLVLTAAGGLLPRLLLPFRLALGGVLGSGRQYMSWITLDDLLGVILHALHDEGLSGPVNAVSPQPVSNREFTRTLGRVLRRPTLFPVPTPLIRVALGQMGEELMLYSARAVPARLEEAGFRYLHSNLEEALRFELGREES